jgi:hypothetical protein
MNTLKISIVFDKVKNLWRKQQGGQSYVELAIALPVLLIMLAGMTEVAFFVARYLDLMDLSRDAARFASVRDPFEAASMGDKNCSTDSFNFYYDTACIFSPLAGSTTCTDAAFCKGMNSYLDFKLNEDDILISVFTVSDHKVSNRWPAAGPWVLSDNDSDTEHNGNWQTNCRGDVVTTQPYYTNAFVDSMMQSGAASSKGFVAVEVYYCYHQVLNLPLISDFIPNPLRIHAYTIMPLPAAQPTPTATNVSP